VTQRVRPRFERRSDWISLGLVIAHLAFVASPVLLAARWGPGWWLAPLWLWFGCSFHGLLNLWHEASHGLVFRERAANDLLGRWILAPLVVGDFDSYRQRHWDHHRFVGEQGDTKDAYLIDLKGSGLGRLLLDCLSLRAALEKRAATDPGDDRPGAGRAWLGRALVFHACFAAVLLLVALAPARPPLGAIVAASLAWGVVFAYGLASLTLLVASLRTLAEHGAGEDDAEIVGRARLRNLRCGPIERLLFGAWGFADHATHHREPAVPSYRLREATQMLVDGGDTRMRPVANYRGRLLAATRGR
jgi:fatty acid desaturase